MKILDVQGLADLLKIDRQTVSRKAQRGEIPGFKIGNRWRFRLSDIEKWIDEGVAPRGVVESNVIKGLSSYFESKGGIDAVYLFGSYATGDENKRSDVDIAVLMKDDKEASMDLQSNLSSELMKLLNADRVDVVFLNNATTLIRYEIIRDGKLLYASRQFDEVEFKCKVIMGYLDMEHIRDVRYDYFLDAVNF